MTQPPVLLGGLFACVKECAYPNRKGGKCRKLIAESYMLLNDEVFMSYQGHVLTNNKCLCRIKPTSFDELSVYMLYHEVRMLLKSRVKFFALLSANN